MNTKFHHVAVVGSRVFEFPDLIRGFVQSLPEGVTLVSGGATNVDQIAELEARARGLKTLIHYPDWNQHGRRAGYLRNTLIVRDAEWVVAFWDGKSPGTRMTLKHAHREEKPMTVCIGPGQVTHRNHGEEYASMLSFAWGVPS